ncbi:glycoside hydrolase family 65 protein [Lactiplantibacillus dongliensis]|uniref:Glycoside hydrolase family 65 protein n=1 Tax=Lactiplantibacillus dongliensis TaxID=2559919 RepID=A0ABW1R6D2_9LACO|nr:glycosyl hydrolase family 65 protein [Lactiplantibacillus dongliensis]
MQLGVKTDPKNQWLLTENKLNTRQLGKAEALMCSGNGYMGIRATTEERYVGERRDMFIAGSFDSFADEVAELPNLPDVVGMQIEVNGHQLNLNQGEVSDYQRQINLKNGLLTRTFKWTIDDQSYQFKFERFVSMDNLHLVVSRVTVTALTTKIIVKIKSGIDGQQTNSGTQHLVEGAKRLFDDHYMQLLTKTGESNINFAFSTCHNFFDELSNPVQMKQQMELGRRQIFCKYQAELEQTESLVMVKYNTIVTDRDRDYDGQQLEDLQQFGLRELKTSSEQSFETLLSHSEAAWQERVWKYGKVAIKSSDSNDQVAINFARYQLAISTPEHDNRMNIAAKGLTGEGYKGHAFWDTEIFMLPYYIFTKPIVAKKLIEYRYLGLAGAHRKASDNQYEGAQFPWEAAWPSDGESTPVWGAADIVTGKAMKIWSGFIEQHITSDVAFGALEYIHATGDQQFALDKVNEIILDTAKFWQSRLEYNSTADQYEIHDVIGPDEYKEHANNNSFTNYTAQWTIQTAIQITDDLKANHPDKYHELDQKLNLKTTYDKWIACVDKVYLLKPNAQGIIPQDDTYLSKKTIDLSKYRNAEHVGGIFDDYNLDQVNQLQVTKQADVLLLLYLFEQKFDAQEKRLNWDYYEPKTTHDSSLSLSTHAILAADLGMQQTAYEFFQRACQIDLGPDMQSSDDGTHSASLGGIWNATVFGFGGVRLLGDQLRIEPHLPANWSQLSFDIYWQQQKVHIEIQANEFTVSTIDATRPISFNSQNQTYQLAQNESVTISLANMEGTLL